VLWRMAPSQPRSRLWNAKKNAATERVNRGVFAGRPAKLLNYGAGGGARTPNALSKDWSETMANLGMKITLHALRHTHASQLIAAGMDVVTISRRLGHASPTITLNVYGHLFSNTDDRAAEIMEAAFSRAWTE